MILHIVLFRWKEGISSDQVDALSREMARLPDVIPELKYLQCGPDIHLQTRNPGFDYGIVAHFIDESAWHLYFDHPAHKAVVLQFANPIVEQRASVQIHLPDA